MRRNNNPSCVCVAASAVRRLTSFRLAGNHETPDVDGSKHPHVRIERVERLWGNLALSDVQWSNERKERGRNEGFSGGEGVSVAGAEIERSFVATAVLVGSARVLLKQAPSVVCFVKNIHI